MKNKILSILATAALGTTLFFASCKEDKCKNVTCNNGACFDGSCECSTGYTGTDCSTEQDRTKFIGNYMGVSESGTISGNNTPYSIKVNFSGSNANSVTIDSLYGTTKTVNATTSGATITIPSQAFGASATVSGAGVLTTSGITKSLSVRYYVSFTSTGEIDTLNALFLK